MKKIRNMKIAGLIGSRIFSSIENIITPGISTQSIDNIVKTLLEQFYAESGCINQSNPIKGLEPFPSYCCVSINEEIVHGIPSDREIKAGDLVSVDLVINFDGFMVDGCKTFSVDPISFADKHLLFSTKTALDRAIGHMKAGVRWNEVAKIISDTAKNANLGIVKNFCGHGIGDTLWCSPRLYNYVDKAGDFELQEGMTLAVEPMFTLGNPDNELASNQWAFVTKDRSKSAHFEHTVLVKNDGVEILF